MLSEVFSNRYFLSNLYGLRTKDWCPEAATPNTADLCVRPKSWCVVPKKLNLAEFYKITMHFLHMRVCGMRFTTTMHLEMC